MFHVAAQALPRKAHQGETIEERSQEWTPPLQRHLHPKTNSVEFLTVKVRILAGDTENDYNAKFPPGPLFAETVCSCIADKQGIPAEGRKMFALWIVGRDIEIQIKPRTNIFQLVTNWNKIVVKYTHFPQALDPAHLVNRYWFIYRREATLSKAEEMRYNGNESIVNLFYGEAKRNVLSGRYTCTPDDASILGALQIQINLGNFDPLRRPPGYISKNMRFLENIIPSRMISLKKPQEWEKCISEQHIRLKGTSVFLARIAYLNMVRQWRCYGCSFFPVCHDPPPAGFFEFRIQKWVAGVGPDGIVVFEKSQKSKYHFIEDWQNVKWIHSDDTVILYDANATNMRGRHFRLISPQAPLIHNLAARLAHLHRKVKVKSIGQASSALARFINAHPPAEGVRSVQSRRPSHDVLGKVQEEDGGDGLKEEAEATSSGRVEAYVNDIPVDQADADAILITFKPDISRKASHVEVSPDGIGEVALPHEVPPTGGCETVPDCSTRVSAVGEQAEGHRKALSKHASRVEEDLATAMEQAVQAAAIETMTPASIRKNPNPRTLSSFQKRPSNTSFLIKTPVPEEDKMMTADYSVGMDGTCAELESGGGVERARRISQNSAQISPRSRTASMSMQPSRVNGPTGAMLSGIASIPNVAVDDNDMLRELEEVRLDAGQTPFKSGGANKGVNDTNENIGEGVKESNTDLLRALEEELDKLNGMLSDAPQEPVSKT